MRTQKLFYMTLAITAVFATRGMSLDSPVNANPLGLGTVPPSAYKSGLIPSINPIDSSFNNVVTGNVAGGMQFRGVVPYRGVTDFTGSIPPGSTGLDSFLRNTAPAQDSVKYGGGTTPFYSPSWTVTTTTPSGNIITAPQSTGNYNIQPYSPGLPAGQMNYYRVGYAPLMSNRPLSISPEELEKAINTDAKNYPKGVEPVSETQSQQQFWQQLRIPMGPSQQLSRNDNGTSMRGTEPNLGSLLNSKLGLTIGVSQEEKGNQPGNLEAAPGQMSNRGPDVYDKMKVPFRKPETNAGGSIGETNDLNINLMEPSKGTETGISSTANPVAYGGIYKSFAAFNDDKFNRHMMMAEKYMKQGRFYRAADAYTLATIYKPGDPLGYAGKSQALFAAGEYMSSSLFLARTLEIFPEYPKVRIDLIAMIGDKDTVESRILEAREWTAKSESGELEFLLSYIYYQMDRMEFSRQAIESAATKMPNSRAVAAMKKAVDERLTKQ
jgi:tetratricopeptide (TPR) repeat protein